MKILISNNLKKFHDLKMRNLSYSQPFKKGLTQNIANKFIHIDKLK